MLGNIKYLLHSKNAYIVEFDKISLNRSLNYRNIYMYSYISKEHACYLKWGFVSCKHVQEITTNENISRTAMMMQFVKNNNR